MNKIAFVTYNSVGDGLSSGWHGTGDRRALVLQNTKGEAWAVNPGKPLQNGEGDYTPSRDRRQEEINKLWGQLQESLSDLDHVVVYVGAGGSERAIELAGQLPASKVTFVACDCSLSAKERLIQEAGLFEAGRVLCECGGRRTMEAMLNCYMATGALFPKSAAAVLVG